MGLLHQLEAEDTLKKRKDTAVNAALTKIKSNWFIITVSGPADIYKREHILSQQCQNYDQHILEVYDNLQLQKNKLKDMLKEGMG